MSIESDSRPIGFFDSGVGGLTVLKETVNLLPRENYIYIGDTKNLPYGTKSPEVVRSLAIDIAKELLKKDVKALVVACNTVSAVALEDLTSLSDVPVIGVIDPTVRFAVDVSETKTIGVIATETTISSGAYDKKLKEVAGDNYSLFSRSTPIFVPLIEEQPHNHPLIGQAIRRYLLDVRDNKNINTLILGCTHYPMIIDQIKKFLGERFKVVNSALPTARVLKTLLEDNSLLNRNGGNPARIIFTSDDPKRAEKIAQEFMGSPVDLQRYER